MFFENNDFYVMVIIDYFELEIFYVVVFKVSGWFEMECMFFFFIYCYRFLIRK